MTTQKALKRLNNAITENLNKNIEDADEIAFLDLFARYFYPAIYKHNPTKAIIKTNLDMTVCVRLGYIEFDSSRNILDDCITITEQGAKRIEEKSDNLRNFVLRTLCAIGGAVGTVVCSFIIQLIQSHI